MLRMFIKRALVWLGIGLLIWLLLTLSLTVIFASNPLAMPAQPAQVVTDEPDYLQQFVAFSETYFTCDWYGIKLEFYNATGIFSFLNSGDCWCPNRLLVRWCNDAL